MSPRKSRSKSSCASSSIDGHALARQQQRQHRPAGAAADDAAGRLLHGQAISWDAGEVSVRFEGAASLIAISRCPLSGRYWPSTLTGKVYHKDTETQRKSLRTGGQSYSQHSRHATTEGQRRSERASQTTNARRPSSATKIFQRRGVSFTSLPVITVRKQVLRGHRRSLAHPATRIA